jgi:hypothetical protein
MVSFDLFEGRQMKALQLKSRTPAGGWVQELALQQLAHTPDKLARSAR